MTVCIAAICGDRDEQGPIVVTAADRMITIAQIEYEPAQTKSVRLASQTLALLAGDMTFHAAVIPRVQERIRSDLQDNPININVSRIAEIYAEEYAFRRRVLAEQHILIPRGLSFDRYASRQAQMAHYQVDRIDTDIVSYYVDASAIVTGIDPDGGHVFIIDNPGVSHCYDVPGFACIGSGEALARTQFMVRAYHRGWDFAESLWMTFDAKARAEKAGGVGQHTDINIIRRGANVTAATEGEKEMLYRFFSEAIAKEAEAASVAHEAIQQYMMSASEAASARDVSADQSGGPDTPAAPTSEDSTPTAANAPKQRAKRATVKGRA